MSDAAAVLVAVAAGLAALGYLVKIVRRAVRIADRIEALVEPTAQHVRRELSHNSGSSMKDQVTSLPRDVARIERSVARVGEQLAVVREVVDATRSAQDNHGHQSRAAMAIYRKALADQGIHLPVAPGEDGYGDPPKQEPHP